MANPNLGAGPGRPKGLPNKSTVQAREAIARFVDGNADRLQDWLDKIAVDSPERAFTLFQSVIEYHVPKLARTVLEGDPDKPLHLQHTIDDKSVLNRFYKEFKE